MLKKTVFLSGFIIVCLQANNPAVVCHIIRHLSTSSTSSVESITTSPAKSNLLERFRTKFLFFSQPTTPELPAKK